MLELRNDNFDAELKNSTVLVDFWAEWCGPCKMLAPVFEEVAESFKGKVKFAKVNIDTASEIGQNNEVRSIPCLILFRNAKEIARFTGYQSASELKSNIESAMKR